MNELNIKNVINQISIEANLIYAQSQSILLNGGDGLDGNNFNAGSLIEGFVKNILKRYLPDRFLIVSGYIIDSEKIGEKDSLKQIDCIIVDKSYPIFYKFKDIDIHIVTKESVCGIIEIKKNLKNSIDKAVDQIRDIINNAGITKTNPNVITSYAMKTKAYTGDIGEPVKYAHFHNPLIGIISLESGFDNDEDFLKAVPKLNPITDTLDFIYCFDGYHLFTTREVENNRYTFPLVVRKDNEKSEWDRMFFSNRITNKNYSEDEKNSLRARILWRTIGFINIYLSALSNADKSMEKDYWEKYYFNERMFFKK